ncbi:hypothetical protein B296_00006519 [Ensete ventricosum]|uniref:Retrotransposon gag domain-containing protein n=1 Tax=Ensete ventricosum TaxID=4639 RepID=A0A427APJ4_ENSVE|nr:hypothetical protein B296_00006519 [Ensete ventricosum]
MATTPTERGEIGDPKHNYSLVVNQRLDEVQKEFVKSKEELGESSKGGSPFAPKIQDKPVPTHFRMPSLESYDGSLDSAEHVVAFRAQMALYDTSDMIMCPAFSTILRGPAQMWPTTATLLGLSQGSDEPLAQFVGLFATEIRGVPDAYPSLVIQEAPPHRTIPRIALSTPEEKNRKARAAFVKATTDPS